MTTTDLADLARQTDALSRDEKLWLIRHIARSARHPMPSGEWETSLAAMAADPDVQRELRAISDEFRDAESDGLGD